MIETTKELAKEVLQSPKMGHVVAVATTGTGISSVFDYFDYIPDSIGKLATLVGMILSITLIRVHIARYRNIQLDNRTKELENKRKELELNELKKSYSLATPIFIPKNKGLNGKE